MSKIVSGEIVGKLRESLVKFKDSTIYKENVEPKNSVLARFQPIFAPERIIEINKDEFHSFLLYENNRQWTGLHRQGSRLFSDMKTLREGLAILVDETKPLQFRLDESIDKISGMGKNLATAILQVNYPDKYGIWNNRSEAAMKKLRIWPVFERGESFGSRYIKVNQVLLNLKDLLQTDLWTIDSLWYYLEVVDSNKNGTNDDDSTMIRKDDMRFHLERHLHEFLRDNWYSLELGQDWEIYKEPGDEEAGYEYPCEIGRIDILAKHKKKPHWLVIELKRHKTSDKTGGQLLRYIGWVKKNLSEENSIVYGLIICRETDLTLEYALSTLPNVELQLYQVEFHLEKIDLLSSSQNKSSNG